MELIASYVVGSPGEDATTLSTPTFTPDAGELVVVKAGNQDDDSPALASITGGGLTWLRKNYWLQGTGNYTDAWLYTAEVVISQPMAVTTTWTATDAAGFHGMIVERWTGAAVDNAPATNTVKTGSGAPSSPLATTGYGSALTWLDVDWSAATGTPVARGVDGQIVREFSPGGTYLAPFTSGRSTGVQSGNVTSHPVTVPAAARPGDVLVVFFSTDADTAAALSAASASDGWQVLGTLANGTAIRQTVVWKIASGVDPLTMTTAAAEQSTYVALSVTNGSALQGALAATAGSVPVTPVVRSSSSATLSGAGTYTVTKPAGLAVGDYLFAVQGADADMTSLTQSAGLSSLGSSAGSGSNNVPPVALWGKVATASDVAAATFSFSQSGNTSGEGVVVLVAIQAGTYTGTPTVGTWTTQVRGNVGSGVATMTAASLAGVANGLLLTAFAADANGNAQTFPTSNDTGETVVAQQQAPTRYATAAVYQQGLTAGGATGAESVTPSGTNTSNGWATVSILFAPGTQSGGSGSTGGSTTTSTTATVASRATGGNDTAATTHTVTKPTGAAAGDSLLCFFNNDTATATASTTSAGWTALESQAQGTTSNNRGTLFYAADAVAAANLVVTLSASEEASWAIWRISGAGTPTEVGANSSGTSVTLPNLTGLPSNNYTVICCVGVDTSTDTSSTQTLTWPTGWTGTTQTRRPGTPGTSVAPDVFSSERRYTAVTSVTPGVATLSLTEQSVQFSIAFPDATTTTTTPGTTGTATPPAQTAAGGQALARLWLTALTLDTSDVASTAQALTPPGGFGTVTRRDAAVGGGAMTATAETTSTAPTLTPGPWSWTSYEEFIASTVVITGGSGGGGGTMRMYAGVNYDATALQPAGPRTIGMTAPAGQAWTLIGIELLAKPTSVSLSDPLLETEELQPLTAGRAFGIGYVDEVDDVQVVTAYRLVAGPLINGVEAVEEVPDLTIAKVIPPLGYVDEVEDYTTPITVSHLVALPGPVEVIEDVQSAFGGGTSLGLIIAQEEVPVVGLGFGGIDIAKGPDRRGLPPIIVRGNVRVMAQSILTGVWLHRELPVSGLQITRTLSGPQVITGSFASEIDDLADLDLEPWGTWVHVEESGEIRASGILMPSSYDTDGAVTLTAHGVSAYAARIPFTGEYAGVQVDPADVVRMLWAHVQSFPRGNLGVVVTGTTTVRMGEYEQAEVDDETVKGEKEAAKAIIDALADPAITVYDDWTWPNCPESVTTWADALILEFRNEYTGSVSQVVMDGDVSRPAYKEIAFQLGGATSWAAANGAAGQGYDWSQDYGAILRTGGSRGYVAGVAAFSTASGALLAVVQAYTVASPTNGLTKYVDALKTLAAEGVNANAAARADTLLGTAFVTAWSTAAGQDAMQRAQRSERDRQFFNPALAQAQADRVGPLGLAIHYTTIVAQGPGAGAAQYGGVLAAARAATPPPAQGGQEAAYLRAILAARASRALTARRPAAGYVPPAVVDGTVVDTAAADGAADDGVGLPARPTGDDLPAPRASARGAAAGRRPYIVGAVKVPYAARDVAHAVMTPGDDRAFLDIIGADTPDDHDVHPVGTDVTYKAELTDEEARRFADASNCRYVVADTIATPDIVGNVAMPAQSSMAWMHAAFPRVDQYSGAGVTIAILDGGTSTPVRNFLGATLSARQQWSTDPVGADEVTVDHGCLVAACLFPVGSKVVDAIVANDDGTAVTSNAMAAAKWAADQGAKIINYSYSSSAGTNAAWADIFVYLRDRGAQFFCSMGNDNKNTAYSPADMAPNYTNVHSSISFDEETGARSVFSNYTNTATGCAPGTDVLGLTPAGAVTIWSGTSASSPHMARQCGMGTTGGRFTAAQVAAALKAHRRNTGQAAAQQGGGAYDLEAALTSLGGFDNLPAVPYRENLAPNASTESGTAGWAVASTVSGVTAALTRRTGPLVAPFGSGYVAVAVTTSAATVSSTVPLVDVSLPAASVVPGKAFVFSVHTRTEYLPDDLPGLSWQVQWLNATGGIVSTTTDTTTAPQYLADGHVWARYSYVATAPAGAVQAVARVRGWGFLTRSDTREWRMDAYMVEQASALGSYLDSAAVSGLAGILTAGNLALAVPLSWQAGAYSFSLTVPPTPPVDVTAPTTDPAVVTAWLRDNVLTRSVVITPAGTPYKLHGYELTLVGKAVDQLGTDTPFEYVEEQGWADVAKQAVCHRIRIAYPAIGSRRDDLNITEGENLLEHAPFEEPDDAYADSAFVHGAGSGEDAVTGFAGVDVPERLRLPKVVTDQTLTTADQATARAHDEVAVALSSVEEIAEVAINVRHENSLWGTFDVGDEVLPRVRLPWLGIFAQWHRITQITYSPDTGIAKVTLSRRDAFRSR